MPVECCRDDTGSRDPQYGRDGIRQRGGGCQGLFLLARPFLRSPPRCAPPSSCQARSKSNNKGQGKWSQGNKGHGKDKGKGKGKGKGYGKSYDGNHWGKRPWSEVGGAEESAAPAKKSEKTN